MMEVATLPNTQIQESRSEILLKIISGEYWLLRREERSTVWHVYRQIVRSDGTKIPYYYFCTGCKRLMQSGDTSSLRSHMCHLKYLGERAKTRGDLDPKEVPRQKNTGHRIHWSYRATKTLLQLWEDNIEHLQNGERSQARIFRKIAKEFDHLGLKPSDIKTKVDSLSDRYRQEAERQKVTGRPSKWQHFHGVQKLLIGDHNALEENKQSNEERLVAIQEERPALSLEENKHWKEKRFMAIKKERLALEKEQIKIFENIMKSYQRNLFQLLDSY